MHSSQTGWHPSRALHPQTAAAGHDNTHAGQCWSRLEGSYGGNAGAPRGAASCTVQTTHAVRVRHKPLVHAPSAHHTGDTKHTPTPLLKHTNPSAAQHLHTAHVESKARVCCRHGVQATSATLGGDRIWVLLLLYQFRFPRNFLSYTGGTGRKKKQSTAHPPWVAEQRKQHSPSPFRCASFLCPSPLTEHQITSIVICLRPSQPSQSTYPVDPQ